MMQSCGFLNPTTKSGGPPKPPSRSAIFEIRAYWTNYFSRPVRARSDKLVERIEALLI